MLLVIVVVGGAAGGAAAQTPPPWTRTESRAPCAAAAPLRAPFYGDLHVHTHRSADAYIFGTRNAPRDAYAFARGGTVPLADDAEAQTRAARIDRPLDFAAVTDHAEFIGEVRLCDLPASGVHDVTVDVQVGTFRTSHTRLWTLRGDRLAPEAP